MFGSLSLCLAPALWAASTGAAFLKIGVGARALGMGSAFTASADDATAVFWNPAGLSRLDQRQVTAMHTEWIGNIRADHLAYAHPTRLGTFAGSAAYLSQDDLERRGENRENLGNFQARDAAGSLAFSRPLPGRAGYGINFRIIEQKIERETARGWSLDLGALKDLNRSVSLGLSIQNLGPRMKFVQDSFQLPLTVTGGIAYRPQGPFQLALDVRRDIYDERNSVSVGTEYWLLDRVAMRTGYISYLAGSSSASVVPSDKSASRLGSLTGFNMGLGLRMGGCQMDYAFTPSGEFGNTQRLSLSLNF
jgi:hypothetical protein